ncbi:DUF1707 domain-containing protein [Saccharopolyspora gloriosae]|uniref:DUF1707 SHOCT-like domain-containing protein n=1 Tax=Saccharopolyspora gloriosae TaxID=455344 RepID=UPI001FB7728B|nr:DUF1707 domain-containing protein [Saccharopolyspora gloriosae]
MRARDKNLRIGDAERETAITLLGEHLSSGRLDLVEYDERCTRAAAARNKADLNALFTDLPSGGTGRTGAWTPDKAPARSLPRTEILLGLGGAALLLALVAVTRDLWLLAFLGVFVIAWLLRRR